VIDAALSRVIEGLVAPRRAVRHIVAGGHGLDVVALLVVLGYTIQAFFGVLVLQVLFPAAQAAGPSVSPVMFHVFNLLLQFFLFFMISGLVFWVGRLMGGAGGMGEVMLAMAWYFFISSALAPLFFFGMGPVLAGEENALSAGLLLVSMAIGLWLLASVVAEVHGFRSTWGVLAVMMGLMLAASLVVTTLVGGPA
jgi:hypothetical protein